MTLCLGLLILVLMANERPASYERTTAARMRTEKWDLSGVVSPEVIKTTLNPARQRVVAYKKARDAARALQGLPPSEII